jgi:hypothetical protein
MAKEFKIGSFAQAVPKATVKKKTVAKKATAKGPTIGGALPKPAKNTTGATNRSSGYLNPFAKGNTPKGAISERVVTKNGKVVMVSGRLNPGASSGYLNKNAAGNNKTTKKVANVKRKRGM